MPVSSGVPASSLTFTEIETAAEEFADKHRFNPLSDDIRDLVKKVGGQIGVAVLPDSSSRDGGSMIARKDKSFVIYLSPFTSVLRDNFTIAHELGHLHLHVPLFLKENPDKKEVRVNRFGNDKPELQANRFAAALLMPEDKFMKVAKQNNWNAVALSVRFSVSSAAAQFRVDSLRR